MSMEKVFVRPKGLDNTNNKFCPGCMHSTFIKICMQVIEELGIEDRTVLVHPIGCANNAAPCMDLDQGYALHGRVPAFATGLKRSNPDSIVFTYQGDGDISSIGLAEVLHAANRGENFCVFFINNCNYGMTGGQMSPTTLIGQKTTTCPGGRCLEREGGPIKMAEIIATLGGTAFSARCSLDSVKNIRDAKKAMRRAFEVQTKEIGFGFVELLSGCPTNWHMDAVTANNRIRAEMIPYFPLGVYKDIMAETGGE